jgi:hypothetical protein
VFYSSGPTRILDTRIGLGTTSAGPIGPDASIDLQVAGIGAVPAAATAAAVTITVLGDDVESFVTVWSATDPRPGTSLLNPQPGLVLSQATNIGLGGGALSIYNAVGSAHAIVDLIGYYMNASDVPSLSGPRVLTTEVTTVPVPPTPTFSTVGGATLSIPPGKWLIQAKGNTNDQFGFWNAGMDLRLQDTTATATLDTVSSSS